MSDLEVAKKLKEIREMFKDDIEVQHLEADELLCEVLKSLGYVKTVVEYEKVSKWYA